MESPIRILLLEDNATDAQLIADTLAADGILADLRRVETRPDFEAALKDSDIELILSDYRLPGYDGMTALAFAREHHPGLPFVLVSGTLGEEVAVECLRSGAADYVVKHGLHRLAPVVRRALKEAEAQRQRQQAEDALRASEFRLNQAERLAHLGSWERCMFLEAGRPRTRLVWSDETYRIFGHEPGAVPVSDEQFFKQVHPDDRDAVAAALSTALADRTPYRVEHRVLRPDGSERLVVELAEIVYDDSTGEATRLIGTVLDITEQRRAEEQLRILARAVDQSPVSIVITDRAGRIEFVNPKFTQVTGYTAAEVLGENPRVLKSGNMPPEVYRQLWQTILAGQEWRGEFQNRRKDGSLFWESASISPVRSADGDIIHLIAIKEDITEKRLTEAKLLRAQRIESIGSLASGIAHDLNNILAPILLCAPLLRDEDSPEGRRELAQTIETSAQRGVEIIKQLLGFGRGKEESKAPLQVRHLIREITKIARETFPRNIQIEDACPSDLWPVHADATQIHQVLLNLCVNARDAMPAGGRLIIRAENVTLGHASAPQRSKDVAGPFVRIQVEDTGVGIPPSVQPHIFESFFTTKAEGQGTGLGLTVAQGIVRNHGGFIHFTSSVGEGTRFEVHLPAGPEADVSQRPRHTPLAPRRGRGELILIVDDESSIREANRRTLERHGYRTLLAEDGATALALFTQHLHDIRLVLTDVMMPQMDGVTLCRVLRSLRPETPIVVSSGGLFGKSGTEALRALEQLGIQRILHKPHSGDLLINTLSEALDDSR